MNVRELRKALAGFDDEDEVLVDVLDVPGDLNADELVGLCSFHGDVDGACTLVCGDGKGEDEDEDEDEGDEEGDDEA